MMMISQKIHIAIAKSVTKMQKQRLFGTRLAKGQRTAKAPKAPKALWGLCGIGSDWEQPRVRKISKNRWLVSYIYMNIIYIYICFICFICVIQSYSWDDPNAQNLEVESTQVWMFIAVVYGSAWFLIFKFVYVWMFMDVYGCL
jgi:hypothetical protein